MSDRVWVDMFGDIHANVHMDLSQPIKVVMSPQGCPCTMLVQVARLDLSSEIYHQTEGHQCIVFQCPPGGIRVL